MIADGPVEVEYEISSAFIVYRNRRERQLDIFAGERRDTLRRNKPETGFEIVNRTIPIDQSTILANHLSLFSYVRSDKHTSELQSIMCISYAVSCLKKRIFVLRAFSSIKDKCLLNTIQLTPT